MCELLQELGLGAGVGALTGFMIIFGELGGRNYKKYQFFPETETPNNFCSSRFSQVCPDFYILLNANLYRKCI